VRRAAALLLLPLLAACASSAPPKPEGPLYDGKPLSFYLEEIRDLSPSRRDAAAGALGYFGPAAAPAIPDLIATIEYPGISGMGQAPDALVAIGPAALPALEKALSSRDEEVRHSAAWALRELVRKGARGPTLVDSLVRGLKDTHVKVAFKCLDALAVLAPESPAAVQGLEQALLDERLAEDAREALGLPRPAK
jgi:HEAT repeat protein